jgi:hypothetical protein
MDALTAELHALELRLLEPAVRASPEVLATLLAPEFVEFGSSGGAYDRAQVIAALSEEQSADEAPIVRTVDNFAVRLLAEHVALATYRVVRRRSGAKQAEHVLRSSIWRHSNGRWQMSFHQGTRQVVHDLPDKSAADP